MGGAFDMARQDVMNALPAPQRRIKRVDRSAWHAEGLRHTFPLQNPDRGLDGSHFRHGPFSREKTVYWHTKFQMSAFVNLFQNIFSRRDRKYFLKYNQQVMIISTGYKTGYEKIFLAN
jgi:hypothetical protein